MEKGLQKYLDKATSVLERFGVMPKEEESPLVGILQEVSTVDEPKVLAIAKTVKYESTFNELVRDNVKDMRVADRYNKIVQLFDSIREDYKKMIAQQEDGKIDTKEKLQNVWMKLIRGTIDNRFNKIIKIYKDVSNNTQADLGREDTILDAYIDFRFAMKDAEILAYEVLKTQEGNLKKAENDFKGAVGKFDSYKGEDAAEKGRLQLARDEGERIFDQENRKYQLIKDVAESLTVGYNVGETLIAKLKQTHDLKDQVYRRSVAYMGTNEHVFTTMDVVYTSQHGLHEQTQTLETMKKKTSESLEDLAGGSRELEKRALKAGYGPTINPASLQKFVDSIVSYQVESKDMITQLRDESDKNAKEVERIVENGKQRYRQAVYNFSSKTEAKVN